MNVHCTAFSLADLRMVSAGSFSCCSGSSCSGPACQHPRVCSAHLWWPRVPASADTFRNAQHALTAGDTAAAAAAAPPGRCGAPAAAAAACIAARECCAAAARRRAPGSTAWRAAGRRSGAGWPDGQAAEQPATRRASGRFWHCMRGEGCGAAAVSRGAGVTWSAGRCGAGGCGAGGAAGRHVAGGRAKAHAAAAAAAAAATFGQPTNGHSPKAAAPEGGTKGGTRALLCCLV